MLAARSPFMWEQTEQGEKEETDWEKVIIKGFEADPDEKGEIEERGELPFIQSVHKVARMSMTDVLKADDIKKAVAAFAEMRRPINLITEDEGAAAVRLLSVPQEAPNEVSRLDIPQDCKSQQRF
uniref:Uncharacterized protein n=1 Tax=Sphaerodactylus townsendi TaxID=933632 RepID=A0ACB8FMP4_9SAUR